jgi:hypothetical protein
MKLLAQRNSCVLQNHNILWKIFAEFEGFELKLADMSMRRGYTFDELPWCLWRSGPRMRA